MSAYTVKATTTAIAMSAALLSHAAAAEAQLGSVMRRAISKPQPTVAQPPPTTSQPSEATGKAVRVKESTEAGPGLMRVRVALKVQGGYDVRGHSGWAKQTVNDSYWSEITLKTDGELTGVNTLDPESVKAADAAHLRLQAQGADAERRSNLRGGPSGGVPGIGNMDMSKLMAMQEKVKACGNDQACKQRLAMEMMNEQANASGSPQMQHVNAQIQEISKFCVNDKRQPMGSKGYEDCMDAEGRKRSTRTDNAVSSEELLPGRYLAYTFISDDGGVRCGLTGRTKIDRAAQGVRIHGDIGGAVHVPYSYTEVGEGDAPVAGPRCVGQALVYDTKTNTVWGSLPFFPPDANITSTAKDTFGNPSGVRMAINDYFFTADVDGQHFSSVHEWVQRAIVGQAAVSGEKTQVFEHRGSADMTTGSGKLTATVSWTIVRD